MVIDDGTPEAQLDEPIGLKPFDQKAFYEMINTKAGEFIQTMRECERETVSQALCHFAETLVMKSADLQMTETLLKDPIVSPEMRIVMEFALDLHRTTLLTIADTAASTAGWLERKGEP